jgi:excisionase family DNA binding protein
MAQWLRIDEVVERLGLTRHQVYRRIGSGQLPASVERGDKLRYVVSEEDLEKYLADGGSNRRMGRQFGEILRVPDVAAVLGFTAETVRRMCLNGDLAYVRGSGPRAQYRIPRASVNAYLTRHGREPI